MHVFGERVHLRDRNAGVRSGEAPREPRLTFSIAQSIRVQTQEGCDAGILSL
jgi:hypothetical protein